MQVETGDHIQFSLCEDPFKILINCLRPNILISCSGL